MTFNRPYKKFKGAAKEASKKSAKPDVINEEEMQKHKSKGVIRGNE